MVLGAHTIGGVEISGSLGVGVVVPPEPPLAFDPSWHEDLATLYQHQIERERRLLLGSDSELQMYSQQVTAFALRHTMTADFSVYHVTTLGGPEEWFCDVIESNSQPWSMMREITQVRVKTHGQDLVFKVIALERPVEKGHCYRMRLEAMGDPRF